MKLREAEQLAKAVLVVDAARGLSQSLRPHRSGLHSLPLGVPLGVPMAGTLRQSKPQSVILESHTSLFKATHFRSIQGHTKATILNMGSVSTM